MIRTILKIFLCAALFSACALNGRHPRLLYGLGDRELDALGERLGYRVDALGMGDYSFTRRGRTFHVLAHYHDEVTHKNPAAMPVELTYWPAGRRAPVKLEIPVARGITFESAEESFRRFLKESHLPSTPPQSN